MKKFVIILTLFIAHYANAQDACSGNWVGNGTVRAEDPAGSGCFQMQEIADCFNGNGLGLGKVGTLWCDATIDVCNNDFNYCWDITTDSDPNQSGDGFTFTLQSAGTGAIGGSAVDIGYGGIGSNTFTVEFDAFDNPAGGLDDGSCGDCLLGFQYDDDPDHGGSYTDSEGFTHNELDGDQHSCLTCSDFSWNDMTGPITNEVCFDWNSTTEMFTVSVNGTAVLGPSKVDLAVILGGNCNVYYGLTTACGGEETDMNACAIVSTMALPQITNTNAVYTGHNVVIQWDAEKSEYANYYEVQRSADKQSWHTVGKIFYDSFKQEELSKRSFEFSDQEAQANYPYYRVVQYNFNKNPSEYSEIVVADGFGTNVHFSYIVSGGDTRFEFLNQNEQGVKVRVYNISGREVLADKFSTSNHVVIASNLNTGIYILEIETNNGRDIKHEKIYIY